MRWLAILSLFLASASGAQIPTFVEASVIVSSGGGCTPTLPASILKDDILIALIETDDEAVTFFGGSEFWFPVPGTPVIVTDETRLSLFITRALTGTPTAASSNVPGDHILCVVLVFRGVNAIGPSWDITVGSTEAVSDTSLSATGGTTTFDDTLVVILATTDLPDEDDVTSWSGVTNANLANVMEIVDFCSDTDHFPFPDGNGGCLFAATGELATAGATGATTATLEDAAQKAMFVIALIPPQVQAGGRVMIIQ